MKLTELLTVAISKIKGVDKAKEKLPVGTHEVDALVHISGTVTKGEDYEQVIWHKATPEAILAVALSKLNGVTIESIVKEAMDIDPERITIIKKEAEEAIEKLRLDKGMTKCKGKVTSKLVFSSVAGKVSASVKEAVTSELENA